MNKLKKKALIKKIKLKTQATVTAELTEQWTKERDELIKGLNDNVARLLEAELVELKDDIDKFRDLEAEYHIKLAKHKEKMTNELQEDLKELRTTFTDFIIEQLDIANESSNMEAVMDSFIHNNKDKAAIHFHNYLQDIMVERAKDENKRFTDIIVRINKSQQKKITKLKKKK